MGCWWSMDNRLGLGSNTSTSRSIFGKTLQGISPSSHPTGLDQIPIGGGLNLGVIGDIIIHKGKSFLTLGSLVSALQRDGDSTIVLNQKIITQDNKNSKMEIISLLRDLSCKQ
jgi:type III secretion protein C